MGVDTPASDPWLKTQQNTVPEGRRQRGTEDEEEGNMLEFTMNDGRRIPAVGYGVFLMTPAEVEAHLPEAFAVGYRHIDTANAYFNEKAVGRAVRASGIPREELFITTKLFPQSYPLEQCRADIDATLRRLDMDYIDLLLLHQPYGERVHAGVEGHGRGG
ncbi:aldo/keto reductase [Actinobaculum sp. 313]|uniref:aldo/keto reductase n=1 Tax=Actinobaculum sp. 313 TaxID=2495645 RepID=UPI00196AC4B2